MILDVFADGNARCLNTEVIDLRAIGTLSAVRVSEVEMGPDGNWYAEIIGGPKLGPFAYRSQAIAAEVTYIESRL